MPLYTCHTSFESSSGHRYDKGDTIDLIEFKDLNPFDRHMFTPKEEEYLFAIEQAF